ncbi:TPA: hypothetical protein N0F65_003500 [Lagenidium giganteum]|uniref:Uncharacterized protein n=1 Tax=Lagenidium giganteum TaxID=4803 RepID=A0AAV2YMB6_9STRA|nr:TPA: hypothetical protein N0F65_003500 [Lagenidium giganteum]
MDDSQKMRRVNNETESILDFWLRQAESFEYVYLQTVARILFAVLASSAEIKRDVCVCGQLGPGLREFKIEFRNTQ